MGKKPKAVAEEEMDLEDLETDDEVEENDDVEDADDEDSEDGDSDARPSKKGKAKKTGRGSGLVPREPVAVSREIYKAQKPEVQKLLKAREKAQAANDKPALRKIRAALRKEGFRLSKVNESSED